MTVTGRSGKRLAHARKDLGGRGDAVAADSAKPDDISGLMEHIRAHHGRLDLLVVNAGVSNAPPLADLDPESYAALMDVNCRGAALTFVRALPLLADRASVVFVGSIAARKGQPADALYAGSKGFISAFARALGSDPSLLARGIRVNTVSPGPIATPLTAAATDDPEADAYVKGLVPMRRWGRPEEVADAIFFLASDQSTFVTGVDLAIDGGMAHA